MKTTLRLAKRTPSFQAVTYQPREIVFSQGDPSDSVLYLQEGIVKLSVVSRNGQEAVVAMLEAGAFFGESALLDDPARHESAAAMTAATVLIVPKERMRRMLHDEQEFAGRFITHMLARNIRLEGDLVDQLFHSSEKRLARALLLLAHAGRAGNPHYVQPRISQQTLADMVGTTRCRVNFFLNKFRRLGYIEYDGGLKVNDSLAAVVLRTGGFRERSSKTG